MCTLFDRVSFYYSCITSTQEVMQDYLSSSRLAEGSVIIADCQTRGQGQWGSGWESAYGQNLLFSLVLYPSALGIVTAFALQVITSLTLYEVVVGLLPQTEKVTIKWPNDLYYQDKKLAGILITTHIGYKGKIKGAIVGIGLNVNQTSFHVSYATSLTLHLGQTLDRSLLFNQLLHKLGIYYEQLQSNRIDLLWVRYIEKLYRKDQWAYYQTIHGPIEGKIISVNKLGQLVVVARNGNQYHYNAKEIVFV